MDTTSFYTRQMLLQYGRQLVAARRLARYNQMLGHSHSVSEHDAAIQRTYMVERVAREITENLIFTGSDNVIVHEVVAALRETLGETVVFKYPPNSLEFKLFCLNEAGEEEEITGEKKIRVMDTLWQVALRVVDATML